MRRSNAANRKQALKVVKELDAFPKVPESYKETTVSGGGISILTFILIFILIISEFEYYTNTDLQFDYQVDTNFSGKVKINIDMTIAMPCGSIGADVLDQTGQDVQSYGKLKEEPAFFELSPRQKEYQAFINQINGFLREEYHALQELMWKSQYPNFRGGMPKREIPGVGQPDACRVHGSFEVSKVAGNFHVTAGKSIPVIPRGHAHIAIMMSEKDYNFSHRIDHFSFGTPVSGAVYPLDGEEHITNENYFTYQYFMQVVPTEVRTYTTNEDTFQFSVTERNRTINHAKGSHGVPGIFVKYDLSSLKIRIEEKRRPVWQFLVRLCGIVGGVFSVSGMLHGLFGLFADVVCCQLKLGKYKTKSFDEVSAALPKKEPLLTNSTPLADTTPVSLLPHTL